MKYGFDTDREDAAIGAFLVHGVYTSRDRRRFKVDTEMWARIERFAKSSAKRSQTLAEFVERLKPRLSCETLRPVRMPVSESSGEIRRVFMTGALGYPAEDQHAVLRALYRETSLCVLLVRERLEREKADRDEDESLPEAA